LYEEGAVLNRTPILQGSWTMHEEMHIVMTKHSQTTTHCRLNHQCVGPFNGPDREWKMTFAQKRTLFGPEAQTVGFVPDAHFGFKAKWFVRDDSDIELVNFWGVSGWLYKAIIGRFNTMAVIDLTPTDIFGISCMENDIPYLGLCFTKHHVDALNHRLASCVFEKFTVKNSPLYKEKLAQTLGKYR
jgi:hypothetical protein